MKIYLVGGAVRDEVLGIPVKDRDWVVVGSSPEEMLKDGFSQVGADFPVFLHPDSMEEYALARTERKTGPGYSGFTCSADSQVTLEEDLFRRDLTINAMAKSPAGKIIDPTGGLKDLAARVFRHVGPAFREDPVRILRVARMCARHPDFVIAPETMALMTDMVRAGEVNALVSERVWKELSRGLMEQKPSRMLNALRDCGALEVLLPELNRLWGVPQPLQWHPENCTGIHVGMVIDHAASVGAGLATRYACLLHDLGKGTTPQELWPKHHCHEIRSADLAAVVSRRLGVPVECKTLAEVVAREHSNVHLCLRTKAAGAFRLLVRCDAVRQPLRFEQLMIACECDARGRLGLEAQPYPQSEMLRSALVVLQSVDVKAISASCLDRGLQGEAIGTSISAARMRALSKWMRGIKPQEVKDTKEASPATGMKRLAP